MRTKRRAAIRIWYDELERLLGLPEGHHIERIIKDKWIDEQLHLIVEGPTLPEIFRGHVPEFMKIEDGKIVRENG